jgi:Alpha-L-arabinofuranosidase B, catalytic
MRTAIKLLLNQRKLLLDRFPGAGSAYSLRKLSRKYRGACIRVRRSSDNAERDIGFSGNFVDTVSYLGFTGGSSGFIVNWYDQSRNNRHLSQTISSLQPRIVNSGVIETNNGKPAIFFDGANDSLSNSSPYLYGSANFHIFSLINTSTGTMDFLGEGSTSTSAQAILGRLISAGHQILVRDNANNLLFSSSSAVLIGGSAKQVTIGYSPSLQMETIVNGTTGINTGFTKSGTSTLDTFTVGARPVSGINPVSGHITEIICFPTYQTAAWFIIDSQRQYLGI